MEAGHRLCLARLEQDLVSDQKTIWTSPLHLHVLHAQDKDRNWLVPLGVGTLGLVAADGDIMRRLGNSPIAHSSALSNYGLAAMIASAASLYLRGTTTNDDHLAGYEAGFYGAGSAERHYRGALWYAAWLPRLRVPDAGPESSVGPLLAYSCMVRLVVMRFFNIMPLLAGAALGHQTMRWTS